MKSDISREIENWSDLEMELGKYTEGLTSVEQMDYILEDLISELSIYISKEEQGLNIDNISQSEFLKCISKPEEYLTAVNKSDIKRTSSNWSIKREISIVSFNYTTIIDRLFGIEDNTKFFGNKNMITLRPVLHIHGYTDRQMVIGVNEHSQIKNQDFQKM